MAFSIKSAMTNLTKLSTSLGYYIGTWGNETQIINSSGLLITGITGITTGSGASTGNVGEDFTASATATDFSATATVINICSQALTAGNYLCCAMVQARLNGATMTGAVTYSISTNSASTTGTTLGLDRGQIDLTAGTSNLFQSGAAFRILKVSSATTVYLTGSADFSAGNPQYAGSLRIIRIS